MSQLLDDIAKPISDSEPSGEDIAKLDSSPENEGWIRDYAELRQLTNKVATNSAAIVTLSQSILVDKSKDLRIAGHLCMALLHKSGFPGLAEALKGYRLLLEEYWDKGLYPSRDAARASNVKSLDGRLEKDIDAKVGNNEYFVSASATDAEAMEEITADAEGIKAILSEKVPDRAASMDGLSRAIAKRLQELGPIAKKTEPPPEEDKPKGRAANLLRKSPAAEETVEETTTAPAEEAAIGNIGSEVEAIAAVTQAAAFLLKKDPKSIAPYKLLRSGLWYSLPLFDPITEGSDKKVTQYIAPNRIPQLEELLQEEEWESLVIQCEIAFADGFASGGGGCFCLDIQRYLSIALKELAKKAGEEGEELSRKAYKELDTVILQETALLVERYPWITELFYSNDMPFADGQTRSWIEKSVKSALGVGSGGQQGAAVGGSLAAGDSQISEEFEQAQELLSRKKWGEAVDMMQNGINSDPTLKGRFQRRLNLANLCLDAGQPAMARPLLEQLDEEIERFSLAQWEPGISVQVWNYLSRCYQELISQDGQQTQDGQQGNGNHYKEKAERVFEKICRLDIRVALTDDK